MAPITTFKKLTQKKGILAAVAVAISTDNRLTTRAGPGGGRIGLGMTRVTAAVTYVAEMSPSSFDEGAGSSSVRLEPGSSFGKLRPEFDKSKKK